MGYIAAFGVVALLIIGIYCFGYAAKQSSILYVLLLETIIGLVLIFPLLLFIDKLSVAGIFKKPHADNWLWLGSASLFGFLGGNYFSLLNIKTAGEKINSLLSPAITAVTIILSFFIFKERLTGVQWSGACITIGVVVWFLLRQKNNTSTEHKTVGLLSGMCTVLFISATVICSIEGAIKTVSFLQAIWLRLLIAMFFILPLFFFNKRHNKPTKQNIKFYLLVLLGVVCQTILAGYLWLYASFHIGISVFQVILATLPLWLYITDVYLLKKSTPSFSFLLCAFFAGLGICFVLL